MIRSQKFWIAVCAVIFAAGLAWSIILLTMSHGDKVTVTRDGVVLYTLDLSKEPDREFTVEYEGRKNVVEIKDGRIRVKEADCPDHVCVRTGWLTAKIPIVCLPNRLVIEYADSDLDAVAG
ncbi:hypothetical protein SAMN02910317_01944 [Ruminococcaceae bacterium FB2012]|nr:hypothetical protein SAMN02910317_01944 [Ruminococcaceae bacterium FB2012]